MKIIINNQLTSPMMNLLKEQINSTFVSYDCEFIEDRILIITRFNFENC